MERLRRMEAPRGADRQVWAEAVRDAARLVADGWADKALALGWAPVDLFGVEPPNSDDDFRNGLGVWLAGRPILLMDADCVVVDSGGPRRSVFNRKRDRSGAVLLWDLGQ